MLVPFFDIGLRSSAWQADTLDYDTIPDQTMPHVTKLIIKRKEKQIFQGQVAIGPVLRWALLAVTSIGPCKSLIYSFSNLLSGVLRFLGDALSARLAFHAGFADSIQFVSRLLTSFH